MMRFVFTLVTVFLFPSAGVSRELAGNRHKFDPSEENVASSPSPSPVTSVPTFEPSSAAVTCAANEDGFFGSLETNNNNDFLDFTYEMETEPNGDLNTAINALEKVVLDYVLPIIFPSKCGSDVQFPLAVVGASINPDDAPLAGVNCTVEFAQGNDCTVMSGAMTLFTDGTAEEVKALSNAVKAEIVKAMNDGSFNDAHPSIVKVVAIDLDTVPIGVIPDIEAPNAGGSTRGDSKLGAPLYIAIAAGAVFIILSALVYRRRQSAANVADADSTVMNNMESGGAALDMTPMNQ